MTTWRIYLNKQPIFYDTDCLSCFIEVEKTWILESVYDKIIIPMAVYKEFRRPKGNTRFKEINRLKDKKFIEIKYIEYNTKEYYTYEQIKEGYITGRYAGKGEAEALSLAIHSNGILASNNTRDVIEIVEQYQIKWVRVGDILHNAVLEKVISENEAEKIWQEMKSNGRYLGKWETLKEYLEHYKK